MSNKAWLFIAVALTTVLIAGHAWAGAQLAVMPKKVAIEKIPSASTEKYDPEAKVVPSYQPGALLTSGEKIKLILTNGVFKGGRKVAICYGTTSKGEEALTADASFVEITLTGDLASTNVYTIRSGADQMDDPCDNNDPLLVRINGGLSVNDTVQLRTSNDPLRIDAGPVTLYTFVQQYSAEVVPVTSVISFADALKMFKKDDDDTPPDTEPTVSKAKVLLKETTGIDDKIDLDGNETFTFKVSGNLSGSKTKKVGYDKNDDGTYEGSATVTDTDISQGYVTFTVSGGNIGTGTAAGALAIEVDGTTALSPRTFTLEFKAKEAGEFRREMVYYTGTTHTWKLDATQFYVPLVGYDGDSGRETYMKIFSKSKVAGSNDVSIQILTSDGTVLTYPAGTISAGMPLEVKGSDLVNYVTAQGKSVDGKKGFPIIVTVNAPESDVFMYANIIDPSGAKRVPVKTVRGTIVE